MSREAKVLVDGLLFPESPRWHDGAFWFSDMHAKTVNRIDSSGQQSVVTTVSGTPPGLGWTPEGQLLVVSMEDHRLLRLEESGRLAEVADFSSLARHLSNDMVVDAQGRAYIGNFGFDFHAGATPRKTNLVLVTPDGEVREVANELSFPNGAVITPDGKTLILGETFAGQLSAFDIVPDGSLENRRVFAPTTGMAPDGICLDAEGAIWIASPISAEVPRIREGGEVLERIAVETQAFACMLGGDEGRILHVCTARGSDPEACTREKAGRIETFEVDVPRAALS
jgi:sugar lactone lactonase YvrE